MESKDIIPEEDLQTTTMYIGMLRILNKHYKEFHHLSIISIITRGGYYYFRQFLQGHSLRTGKELPFGKKITFTFLTSNVDWRI